MAPTTNTKGLLIGYADPATDNGDRPLPGGAAFWVSPNIRLATSAEVATLVNPATWETTAWDGTVTTGTAYSLLIRLRNTDATVERHNLNLEGWVADYTAGGVGPGSAILQDPTQPPGPTNPVVSFNGFNFGPLPAGDPANPGDPTLMRVLISNQQWTPTDAQTTVNGGHVCVAVNVFAEADSGATGGGGDGVILAAAVATPQDGERLLGAFIDPIGDRKHGQRNIMIVARVAGTTETRTVMVQVPATDRCPLVAEVTLRPVIFAGGEATLGRVPELADAARAHTGGRLALPGYPLPQCAGMSDGHHDHDRDHDKMRVKLDPGERADLTLKFKPAKDERPGDVQTFDVLTQDTVNHQLVGAARVFVLVTDPGGVIG
jgi:hypothetical protein